MRKTQIASIVVAGIAFCALPQVALASPQSGSACRAQLDRAAANTALGTKVEVAIVDKLGWDGMGVRARAHNGHVTLRGRVDKSDNPQIAQQIAQGVPGVDVVRNEVVYLSPEMKEQMKKQRVADQKVAIENALNRVDQGANDIWTAAKVEASVLSEVGSHGFGIKAACAGGVATLTGNVPDEARRTLAVNAARGTDGVTQVVDNLQIQAN